MNVHVHEVSWESHQTELRAVRNAVFIEEQNVPRDLEWDGMDETSNHFIAETSDGDVIGTARLMPSGQIGRMAIVVMGLDGVCWIWQSRVQVDPA